MEPLPTIVCLFLVVAVCIVNVSATSTSDTHRDDVIEELLNRVNRLEARAEYQQRVQNDLRAQLLLQKKRTSRLEKIVLSLTTARQQKGKQVNRDNTVVLTENNEPTGKPTERRSARSAIRQVDVATQVAFFATLSGHQIHLGNDQSVEFDHVITNTGNAYNPHLGAFVVPVPGTYVISSTITTYGSYTATYYMSVNDKVMSYMYVDGGHSPSESSSQTAVLHLMTGDVVTIKNAYGDQTAYGYSHSAFSGFLLHQQESPVVVGK